MRGARAGGGNAFSQPGGPKTTPNANKTETEQAETAKAKQN